MFSVKLIFAANKYQNGVIGGDEIIADDILLYATNIEVSGKVNRMLFAIGKNISISSSAILETDVFPIAQRLPFKMVLFFNGMLPWLVWER